MPGSCAATDCDDSKASLYVLCTGMCTEMKARNRCQQGKEMISAQLQCEREGEAAWVGGSGGRAARGMTQDTDIGCKLCVVRVPLTKHTYRP